MVTRILLNPLLQFLNRLFEATPSALRPYRWWVVAFTLGLSLFMGVGLATQLKLDLEIDSWFDEKDPAKLALDDFRREFGSDDGVYVVYQPKDKDLFSYESLTLIHELTQDLIEFSRSLESHKKSRENYIEKITSITNSRYQEVSGDTLRTKTIIDEAQVPTSKVELEALRGIAAKQRNMVDALFSKDYQYGALRIKTRFGVIPKGGSVVTEEEAMEMEVDQLSFDASLDVSIAAPLNKVEFEITEFTDYIDFIDDFNHVINQPKYKEHFQFYPVGGPVTIAWGIQTIGQSVILILGMLLVIMGLLWVLFRSLSAVFWSVCIIILNSILVLGATAWLGIAVSTLLSFTIMLMITVGVADCVHVMSTYLFYRRQDLPHEEAITKATRKTGVPILITSLTTMLGMLSLTGSDITQFVVFGAMSASSVLVAWALTWILLPILLDFWHPANQKSLQIKEKAKVGSLSWLISAG